MAVFTKSVLFEQISGKVGTAVFTSNKSGPAIRAHVIPANPRTARQVASRGRITAAGPAWEALSEANRSSWETYASNTPLIGRMGREHYVSGFDMFTRAYSLASFAGVTLPTAGPGSYGLAASPGLTSVAVTAGTADLVCTWPVGAWWKAITGAAVIAKVFAPQKPTRTSCQSAARSVLVVKGNAGNPPAGPVTIVNPWGTVAAGQVVYIELVALDADGQISAKQELRVVAA